MSDPPDPHQPDPDPRPPKQFAPRDYYHLIHTLYRGLPPPVDDTPEALLARNAEAIAELAAMLPTNANEAAWAAQCVAARAQANDVMRLLREYAGDEIKTVMRLNAQYMAMTRTSQGAHSHLLRAQAVRYRREKSDAALKADEWTQYIVARSLEQAMEARPAAAMPAGEDDAQATQPGEQPPAPAAEPPPPASPPTPVPTVTLPSLPAAAPRSPRRSPPPAELADPPRDLLSEVEYYAAVYPDRARAIRCCGGLPPNCSFGPPDDDMVKALLVSTIPALLALDGAIASAD